MHYYTRERACIAHVQVVQGVRERLAFLLRHVRLAAVMSWMA